VRERIVAHAPVPVASPEDQAMAEEPAAEPIRDIDRDSLYILPLAMIPMQTPALRRARMIKNVRLDSIIEMFEDAKSGSGQIEVEDLPQEFNWRDSTLQSDLLVLRKLSQLPSFQELTSYMMAFTRPLIVNIYGDADLTIQTFEDIVSLFRAPDVRKALDKLRMMAEKLEIKLEEIPKFLEDYGDIFLSLSYYRQCLDQIEPLVSGFLEWLEELRGSWPAKRDPNLLAACRMIQETMNATMLAITGRFESFDRSTKDLWEHVSADRFRKVETLIQSYHTTIGGILCALTVKMETWAKTFGHKKAGGPAKRAEFIMTGMRQGMEKIQNIENSAPALAQLR
jgi:hypothetical protein